MSSLDCMTFTTLSTDPQNNAAQLRFKIEDRADQFFRLTNMAYKNTWLILRLQPGVCLYFFISLIHFI